MNKMSVVQYPVTEQNKDSKKEGYTNGTSNTGSTFTIDEAVNKSGYGRFQIQLTCLAGLGWLTDACEIFILSIIGDFIACDWTLYLWQNALLTSTVFCGIMIGSPVLGTVADIYGRKICLGLAAVILFLFGCLSAVSPSFSWMIFFRACMGFALGGVAQGLTLCMEYCPTHLRGKSGFYLCYFWSFGSIIVVLAAWAVMSLLNSWRILLVIVALPGLLVVITLKWYPESARFYLVSNKYEQATKVLEKMALVNKVDLPDGKLVEVEEKTKRGRIQDLFSKEYRVTTILFWYIWLACAFSYYGIVLITPTIVQQGSVYGENFGNDTQETYLDSMEKTVSCVVYTTNNYINLLWTSAAEFPGLVVFTLLVEHMSRKRLLSISCFICSVLILLLLIRSQQILLLCFLFGARAIIAAIFQLIYIMTTETYPTTVRALAMGTGSAFSRIGGLIVPYVAQILIIESPIAALCMFAAVIFLCGIATIFLPFETKGKNMKDSARESKR